MKKIFTLLAMVLLCTSLFAANFNKDDIAYNILSGTDKTVEVTAKSPEYTGDVTIPATVTNGGTTYTVTAIGASAFEGCNNLTAITIPNTVTAIGESAFDGCKKLTAITIPNSVTSIGAEAFRGCSQLTHIAIPTGVTSIGSMVFFNCSGLTAITIPQGVTSIAANAFNGCYSIAEITVEAGNETYKSEGNCLIEKASNTLILGCKSSIIPEGVTTIGESAFYNCSKLTAITIPSSVTTIGYNAFCGCSSIESITLPNSITSIGKQAFQGCSKLVSINIPLGVTSIGNNTFTNCTKLQSITLPSSVKSIGIMAFNSCTSLTSIHLPEGLKTIDVQAFNYCEGLTNISIPASVTSIGTMAFGYCEGLTEITCLATTPPTLGSSVFNDVPTTIPVYVPASALTAYQADDKWSYFTNIQRIATDVPAPNVGDKFEVDGIHYKYLGENKVAVTYEGSSYSTATQYTGDVEIPATIQYGDYTYNVTEIGTDAFRACTGLTSVIIHEGITKIGDYAFHTCTGLTEITCQATTPPTLKVQVFYNVPTTIPVYVPANSVATYKGSTGWINFKNIQVMKGEKFSVDNIHYTSLGNNSVEVTYEGSNYTTATKYTGDVEIPATVKFVNVSYNVTAIGENAFHGGTNLTSITIPSSVASIGEYAFYQCSSLEEITCLATTPPTAYSNTFSNVPTVIPVYVPASSVTAYESATGWNGFTNYQIIRHTVTIDGNSNLGSVSDAGCDIVVTNGATLTCDAEASVGNVTIEPGGKLIVQNLLRINGTLTARSEGDAQPEILNTNSALNITADTFCVVKRIRPDRYYFFSLPFDCSIADVTIDGAPARYNVDWNYCYYDGAGYALGNANNYWLVDYYGTIHANKGYCIGVAAETADTYRELTFTAPNALDNLYFGNSVERKIPVAANDGGNEEQFKGWNFIKNPYMSGFSGTISIPGVDPATAAVKVPEAGTNKTYEDVLLSELANLPPFAGFFVQVGEAGNVVFNGSAQNAPARKANSESLTANEPLFVGVSLSNGATTDETTLIISEQYTDAYEIGSDFMKMVGYGDKPQVYTYDASTQYAFHSLNEASAAKAQPMGVYLPAAGEYTFSMKPTRSESDRELQALYLYDYETSACVNLMQSDYTFRTSGMVNTEKRFALSASFASDVTTAESVVRSAERDVQKVLENGHVIIVREGVRYDVLGRKV